MALKTSAYIGTTSSIDSATVTKDADLITLQNGLHQYSYPREVTYNGSKEVTLGGYWGIYDNDHTGNTLFGTGVIWESATWTRTDVVSDRRMTSHSDLDTCDGGTTPNGTQVLQFTDNMIWLGYNETLSATIKCSDYGITAFKPGDRFTADSDIAIIPAVGVSDTVYEAGTASEVASGAYSAITGAAHGSPVPYIWLDMVPSGTANFDKHFIVSSISHNETMDDWHNVSLELTRFVPTTDPTDVDQSALLTYLRLWTSDSTTWSGLCNTCSDFALDFSHSALTDINANYAFYSITITTNLTSGGNPTYTEAIDFFPSIEVETNYSPPA